MAKKILNKQTTTNSINNISTIKLSLGILVIILGVIIFLALINFQNLSFLKPIKVLIYGLSGAVGIPLSLFVVWIGIAICNNNKFDMKIRSLVILFIIYLQTLALIDLASSLNDVKDRNIYKLMDYILIYNRREVMLPGAESFSMFFTSLFTICSNSPYMGQAGGALGNIFAWPLWTIFSSALGVAVLVVIILITIFIFIKLEIINPISKSNKFNFTNRNNQNHNSNIFNPYDYYNEFQNQVINSNIQNPNTNQPYYPPYNQNSFGINSLGNNYNPDIINNTNSPNRLEGTSFYDASQNDISVKTIKPIQRKKQNKPVKKNLDISNEDSAVNIKESPKRKNKGVESKETSFLDDDIATSILNVPEDNVFKGQMSGKRFENIEPEMVNNKTSNNIKTKSKNKYIYPQAGLLNMPDVDTTDYLEIDQQRAALLEETLDSFGISAKVVEVTHGPAVTRFELDLASGINVKKINNISNNIALNMAAESGIRIEAPIPGKTLVGIEIPNKKVRPVSFREVMFSNEMMNENEPLSIALGKDINGKPIICNLEKMPHLLIAGATGSGKSVCINSIICSLVYRCSPDDCRLILIDPKMVELHRYNVLPHLLIPVVCEPSKASGSLAWALAEMYERYNKFKDCNVSNITSYNKNIPNGETKLPRIVVVVDELADLMISSSKREIEDNINRIAAVARAAGIHLVVATQRPSVDVITGVIKANLLSRIAFLASSGIDSRTILDRYGAENLVGYGDMLYMPAGYKNPLRVQGCFLKNEEINGVLKFIKNNFTTEFDENAMEAVEKGGAQENTTNEDDGDKVDPLLEDAIDMVISDGQASISMLQRRMSIGYARAGRLIDGMTKRGIISKSQGSKPREVLMSRAEFEEIRNQL